jgi:hypothetical protein
VSTTEGQKDACKTYLEQTKLLVTLASAFLFAPPGFLALLKDRASIKLETSQVCLLLGAEGLFVFSVLCGYVAVASLTGSQDEGKYDVYRPATRAASILQFGSYLLGIGLFVGFVYKLLT